MILFLDYSIVESYSRFALPPAVETTHSYYKRMSSPVAPSRKKNVLVLQLKKNYNFLQFLHATSKYYAHSHMNIVC